MSEVKKETKAKKTTKKVVKEEKKDTKVVKKTRTKKESKLVKEKALLDDKDQIKYTAFCKIVKILAKIGKICLMIIVPFIFLTMIITPIVFKNFQIEANIIRFDDLNIIVNDDKVTLKLGNDAKVLIADAVSLDKITSFLTNNSKSSVITYIELSLLLVAIIIILNIYLLSYIEKLFNNFINKHTPFMNENTNYLFRIIILISAIKFIDICLNTFEISTIKTNSFSIFTILILCAVYVIFKYAVKLQEKNNSKICD